MAYGLTQSPTLVAATPSYFATGANPANLNITGDLTIEAWINLTSTPGSGGRMEIVSKPNNAGTGYETYSFEIYNDGSNVNLRLVNSGPTQRVNYAWNPSTATWYHVAVTKSGGDYALFVNGSSVATNTSAGAITGTTSAVAVGNFDSANNTNLPFDGRISLVRIWNTALSGATILANICTVYGTATTNMQAEWSLDNVVTDASGNGYTLTNINSVVFSSGVPAVCAVVGPTNLKSLDTNLKANIKTYNTNPLANIKSINTNT